MTAVRPARMITKSRPPIPTRGKRGDVGRFVTLRSGQVIFIPKGGGSKWADVRDRVLASQRKVSPEVIVEGWEDVPLYRRQDLFPGVTEKDLQEAFDMPGMETKVEVATAGGVGYISAQWWDGDDYVGKCDRWIGWDGDNLLVWHGDLMEISKKFRNRGLAQGTYDRQIELARRMGCDRMEIHADLTIGRYAWAKKGYRYRHPAMMAPAATEQFKVWIAAMGLEKPSGGWPKFTSAYEVATYRDPAQMVLGRDISNEDVPADMELELGKAFMLDRHGHGAWGAELKL